MECISKYNCCDHSIFNTAEILYSLYLDPEKVQAHSPNMQKSPGLRPGGDLQPQECPA